MNPEVILASVLFCQREVLTSIIDISPVISCFNGISPNDWTNDNNEEHKAIRDHNSDVSIFIWHQPRFSVKDVQAS